MLAIIYIGEGQPQRVFDHYYKSYNLLAYDYQVCYDQSFAKAKVGNS